MSLPIYPEYKDSGIEWSDQLPAHWGVACLKWICQRYSGGTPDKSNIQFWEDGTIPWLNSGAVNDGRIYEPSALITQEAFENSSAKWIPSGALVMALAGQGKTKGMVAQLMFESTCNQSMAAIVPGNQVVARFLYWWLVSNYQNIRNMAGGDLRDGLNLDLVGEIPCPLPLSGEQVAIAKFLDRETAKIDALIAEQEALLALLAEKRQATISHVVTRGLDPTVPMKNSGIAWLGEVPAHWEVRSIKSLAIEAGGIFIDGDWIESRNLSDEGVRYITTGNVGLGFYKEQGSGFISEETFSELDCTEVLPGDVLISRLNLPIGRACLAPDLGRRVVTSVDNVIFRPSAEIDRSYLVYRLSAPDYLHEAANLASGATMQRISRTELGTIRIALPTLQEQQQIAASLRIKLERLDLLVIDAQKSIELLRERRTALIAAAVTGKIDVGGLVERQAA